MITISATTVGALLLLGGILSSNLRSIFIKAGTTIGSVTGLDIHTFSAFSSFILYLYNYPFLDFKIDLKIKFMLLFLSNIVILSLLGFCFTSFSYLYKIYDEKVNNQTKIDWDDVLTKYIESLKGYTKETKTFFNKLKIFIYTAGAISFSTLLLKNFPWKYIVLPILYFILTLKFFELVYNINTSFLGKFKQIPKTVLDSTQTLIKNYNGNFGTDNIYYNSLINYDYKNFPIAPGSQHLNDVDKQIFILTTHTNTSPYTINERALVSSLAKTGKVHYMTPEQYAASSPKLHVLTGLSKKKIMEENGVVYTIMMKEKNKDMNNAMISNDKKKYNNMFVDLIKSKNEENKPIKQNNNLLTNKSNVEITEYLNDKQLSFSTQRQELDHGITYISIPNENGESSGQGLILTNDAAYTATFDTNGNVISVENIGTTGSVGEDPSTSIITDNDGNGFLTNENGEIIVLVSTRLDKKDVKDSISQDLLKDYTDVMDQEPIKVNDIIEQYEKTLHKSNLEIGKELVFKGIAVGAAIYLSYAVLAGYLATGTVSGTALNFLTTSTTRTAGRNAVLGVGQYILEKHGAWNLIQTTTYNFGNIVGISSFSFSAPYSYIKTEEFRSLVDMYKKNYINNMKSLCQTSAHIVCKNNDVLFEPLISFKQNVLKIYLFLKDLSISVSNEFNNLSYFKPIKINVISDMYSEILLRIYCAGNCTTIEHIFYSLFDNNVKTIELNNIFKQFYRYNDVSWTKGVYDYVFLLYNLLTNDEFNQEENFVYYNPNSIFYNNNHFKGIFYNGEYLTCSNDKISLSSKLSISKTDLLESLKKYMIDRITTDTSTLNELKLHLKNDETNEIYCVNYENLEKFFKDILVLNNFIYTDQSSEKKSLQDWQICLYNRFQLACIIQYLNFGDYKIMTIKTLDDKTYSVSIVNSRTKESFTESFKSVELVYEYVINLNVRQLSYDFLSENDEENSIYDGYYIHNNLDVYNLKLVQYDLYMNNIFSERNYTIQKNDTLIEIKTSYENFIKSVNQRTDVDHSNMYLILQKVTDKQPNINNEKLKTLFGLDCSYVYGCNINILKIIDIVQTWNIDQYLFDSSFTYYISFHDFFMTKNVNNVKDIDQFLNKQIQFNNLNIEDKSVINYKEFLNQEVYTEYPYQIDNLRIYMLDKGYISTMINPFPLSIVVNKDTFNYLNEKYTKLIDSKNIELLVNDIKNMLNKKNISGDEYSLVYKNHKVDKVNINEIKYISKFEEINFGLGSISLKTLFSHNHIYYPFSDSKFYVLELDKHNSRHADLYENRSAVLDNDYKFLVSEEILKNIYNYLEQSLTIRFYRLTND